MGLLGIFFPALRKLSNKDGKDDIRLSTLLPKKQLALVAFAWALAYLILWPRANKYFALAPFVLMATKGVDLGVLDGLVLSVFWITYTLVVSLPFYPILGRYLMLMVYVPILGVVYYKKPHEKADTIFLFMQSVYWDFPLIQWMKMVSYCGGRGLKPFHSKLTKSISMGSMPVLPKDAHFLAHEARIGLIINMCREFDGLQAEYQAYGIQQVHLPTPDVCEPTYEDILLGVYQAKQFIDAENSRNFCFSSNSSSSHTSRSSHTYSCGSSKSNGSDDSSSIKSDTRDRVDTSPPDDANKYLANRPKRRIFVHCKAGRGRAAAMALCIMLAIERRYKGDIDAAMAHIREKRAVVESYVKDFKVVNVFVHRLFGLFDGDIEKCYMHDYVLSSSSSSSSS